MFRIPLGIVMDEFEAQEMGVKIKRPDARIKFQDWLWRAGKCLRGRGG